MALSETFEEESNSGQVSSVRVLVGFHSGEVGSDLMWKNKELTLIHIIWSAFCFRPASK